MGIIIHKNKNIQENVRIRQDVKNIDLVKGTIPEQEAANVGVYEYAGYHRNSIASYLKGQGGGSSYSRQYDTATGQLISCGLSFYDRMIQQEEMLITSTGEPVWLLRRKWTGELCPCWDKNRQRADGRCPTCFGVGYVGGYVGFVNPKEPEGRIYIRIYPNTEDLKSIEHGLTQSNEIQAWALPVPTLRDRDVIVRFDPYTKEESWRYVITEVTRNMGLFNTHTAQTFNMTRLDKTHPINFIRMVDLLNYQVGDLMGRGDELQDKIEAEHGDGFQDGGFSFGYFSGYDFGYHDAFYQKPYRSIPDDNQDGWIDEPFWQARLTSDASKEFWLVGYRNGYKDGFEDGDTQRLKVNPPDRLPEYEIRRVDIPNNLAGHPNERVVPPVQSDLNPDNYRRTDINNTTSEQANANGQPGTDVPCQGCPDCS